MPTWPSAGTRRPHICCGGRSNWPVRPRTCPCTRRASPGSPPPNTSRAVCAPPSTSTARPCPRSRRARAPGWRWRSGSASAAPTRRRAAVPRPGTNSRRPSPCPEPVTTPGRTPWRAKGSELSMPAAPASRRSEGRHRPPAGGENQDVRAPWRKIFIGSLFSPSNVAEKDAEGQPPDGRQGKEIPKVGPACEFPAGTAGESVAGFERAAARAAPAGPREEFGYRSSRRHPLRRRAVMDVCGAGLCPGRVGEVGIRPGGRPAVLSGTR